MNNSPAGRGLNTLPTLTSARRRLGAYAPSWKLCADLSLTLTTPPGRSLTGNPAAATESQSSLRSSVTMDAIAGVTLAATQERTPPANITLRIAERQTADDTMLEAEARS